MLNDLHHQSSSSDRGILATAQLWAKLLLALMMLILPACRSQPEVTLPTELIGTWRTDHPKYAGLYFQVSPDSFAFSTLDGTVDVYTLTKYELVESIVRNRKLTTHVLQGTGPSQETKISLAYEPSGGGFIRLSSQANILWSRQNGPPQ